jgi:hypothetical protein
MKQLSVTAALAVTLAIVLLEFSLLVAPAYALDTVVVELGTEAALLDDGRAIELQVAVSCPKRHDVLEAFVYVGQDGNQSQFAGIPVRCKGKLRQYVVRVLAFPDAPFHPGQANASAYVLVYDPDTGMTQSGSDGQTIQLH